MSEPPSGITPRDHKVEERRRVAVRRRRIAVGVTVAVVSALGVAQLAFGWVNRLIDATGWTCGGGWERIEGGELADMHIIRWGTPEVREQGVDPEQFTDLPPGLAEPSLTSPGIVDSGAYDPLLYPLDGGVVLQADGYYDHTWVGADARTGEPLWGVAHDASGYSTIQGRFSLLAEREDGRTDLTTFDPRTGEKLSCVRLDGTITAMSAVGESDIAVALRSEEGDDEQSTSALLRLDPVAGDEVWTGPLEHEVSSMITEGEDLAVSSSNVGLVTSGWFEQQQSAVVTVDAEDGHLGGSIAPSEGRWVAIGGHSLPDGGSGTVLYGFEDQQAWSDREAVYMLVDASGTELWRVEAEAQQDDLRAWISDGVVVLSDGWGLMGVDVVTGEVLWRNGDLSVRWEDIAGLDADGVERLLVTDQRVEDEDGNTRFVALLVDPRTGESTRYDAALRSAVVTDSYLLTDSGMTQLVIPLEES